MVRKVRALLAAAIVFGVAIGIGACGSTSSTSSSGMMVASAQPGVDHASLMELAGSLVGGSDKLADPSTGRLPDVNAFHAAGIATLTVSGDAIRVVFLDSSTAGQRQAVENTLRSSPLIMNMNGG